MGILEHRTSWQSTSKPYNIWMLKRSVTEVVPWIATKGLSKLTTARDQDVMMSALLPHVFHSPHSSLPRFFVLNLVLNLNLIGAPCVSTAGSIDVDLCKVRHRQLLEYR